VHEGLLTARHSQGDEVNVGGCSLGPFGLFVHILSQVFTVVALQQDHNFATSDRLVFAEYLRRAGREQQWVVPLGGASERS
jgi:hypothetical protein